jgi:plastocyanin
MMHRLGQVRRRRGAYAAVGTLAACGALAGVGAAGAAQQTDATVAVVDTAFNPDAVDIETGDKVTWNVNSFQVHNVKGGCPPGTQGCTPGPAEDPAWAGYGTPLVTSGTYEREFDQPGTYRYYCQAHPEQMQGTITVTGPPVTPTPTPSPTETPTTTPTPQPTVTPTATPSPSGTTPVDDHTTTPAPVSIASADSAAPALSGLRLKALRRGARVTFKLSEPATVTLRFKKRGTSKVVRTVRLQARPGTRTVTVHSARLKRGRYTVELQARDASGKTSTPLRSDLRIRRK